MTDEKKIPERWKSSSNAVKAVQVAFDTGEEIASRIRLAACQAGISPSDQIRCIIGLPTSSKAKRPRLTVTLSDEDYSALAERYGLPEHDKLAIKKRVMEELAEFDDRE